MKKVLITGAGGQLGSSMELEDFIMITTSRFHNDAVESPTIDADLDITNEYQVKTIIAENDPDIIVHLAAMTNVDGCELNPDQAYEVNVRGTVNLLNHFNGKFVLLSTDYVFDGENYKPYSEDDVTNPNGVYGSTKLDGENAMKKINPKNSIIIRTSWVYSSYGANFVKTMLRLGKERDSLGVIYDQVGTPTYARDLAKTILDIIPNIRNKIVTIYNYSNEGVLSWYDFSKEIMKMAKIECEINPIETKDYPTPSKRPHYSLLNKSKIKEEFNLTIPFWKDSLDECLKTMGERK